eukprot:745837-Hanusia_phi.AAC.3
MGSVGSKNFDSALCCPRSHIQKQREMRLAAREHFATTRDVLRGVESDAVTEHVKVALVDHPVGRYPMRLLQLLAQLRLHRV